MIDIPQKLTNMLGAQDFSPQRPFPYSRELWSKWLGHLDGMTEFLADLPDALDRKTVAEIVEKYVQIYPAGAFVAAMIWGYGSSGYGPYRTAYILTGSRNLHGAPVAENSIAQLSESARLARDAGAVEGYRYLNNRPGKLAGLGPAFFTKWLYFVTTSAGGNTDRTAPILDRLVVRWLSSEASMAIKPARTPEYERYIDTLSNWGSPFRLAPADVEERIFRLIRDDGIESKQTSGT